MPDTYSSMNFIYRHRHIRGFHVLLVLFALFCLSLAAIQPFTLGKMPLTADGTLHLYRVIALDHSLTNDHPLWVRYSSGLVYGYGTPLFNYFSPLSYYLPRILHQAGMTFLQGWLAAMSLYILVSAGGAYLLGRSWAGQVGGLVTAIAYVYSPYMLFDTVARGTITEVASLAILPWALWAFRRLALYGRRQDMLLAVTSFTIFILMHNIITLHSMFLFTIYCGFLWLTSESRKRVFLQLMLAGILALLMTAFFWLPALAETDAVKINEVTENLPQINVLNHLRPASEVFALPPTADPTQLQQPTPITLSLPQIGIALVGLILAWRRQEYYLRSFLVLMILLLVGYVFLNTNASAFLWETIPLIGYTQFAWRTLGLASIVLALLSGIGAVLIVQQIKVKLGKIVLICGLLLLMTITSLPWLYTLYTPDFETNSIIDVHDYERESGQLALSSFSEYLPVWNQAPLDSERLQTRFAENDIISRLEPPPGVTLIEADWHSTRASLSIHAETETSLVFDWLYVPGWVAMIDDEAVPVEPTDPQGLVSIAIPEGDHTIFIGLEATSIQSQASLISMAGLGIFVVILSVGWKYLPIPTITNNITRNYDTGLDYPLLFMVIAIGVVLFLGKALIFDHTNTPIKSERFRDGIAAGVQISIEANFNHEIQLLGVDLPPESIPSGEIAQLNLYWQLNSEQLDTDYSSVIYLRDAAGNIVAETGSFAPGDLATSNWLPGYYVQERLDFMIPFGIPPGTYTLDAGLFLSETQQRLNHINAAGNPEDVKVLLGTIQVARPLQSREVESTQQFALIDDLYLVNLPVSLPAEADVGQELEIVWTWRIIKSMLENYHARLVWLDEEGAISASTPVVPLTIGYLTSQWQLGDIWTGHHRLYVPGSLGAGDYRIGVQLIDEAGEPTGEIGRLEMMIVTAPERNYEIPEIEFVNNYKWQNGIHLLGYSINEDNDDGVSSLTLYWQSEAEITESLRLFVHLLDGEQIIAQSDSVPADWTRPTTGWSPGEIIKTDHPFNTSSKNYDIRVGWYDPISRDRIALTDRNDSVVIPAQ